MAYTRSKRLARPEAAAVEQPASPATPKRQRRAPTSDNSSISPLIPVLRCDGSRGTMSSCFKSLDDLKAGIQHILAADPVLAPVIDAHGLPTKLVQQEGSGTCFEALAKSVIYQQLHGKAAASIHQRLLDMCKDPLTPEAVLSVSRDQLRSCGLSDRKAEYVTSLAQLFAASHLSDGVICKLPDDQLIELLTQVKGIGPWTCQMLAIFHLGRTDILPHGDLGVRKGMQVLYGLPQLPSPTQMDLLAGKWAPYRSLGSYYMWQVPTSKSPAKPRKSGKRPTAAAVSTAATMDDENNIVSTTMASVVDTDLE